MPTPSAYFGHLWITRLLLQRGMAAIYSVAFLSVVRQFKPLLGTNGLLPVPNYLQRVTFRTAPSLFHWHYSDRLLDIAAWTSLIISLCALCGLTEAGPLWLSVLAWLILWVIYLSIVNVGQTFFGFGWESMLLEAGFFTAFLGSTHTQPSVIPIFILRWMLFRTELGAGLIKLRHDPCWRSLTCLYFHYETQPLPNPLSWYFHRLPRAAHRFGVLASHFIQIIVPFALFAPQPFAAIAAALIIFQQLWLIISGNYSWLNWLTLVLGVSAFSDRIISLGLPLHTSQLLARPFSFDIILWLVAAATVALSVQPVLNLFSKNQLMNSSYNPLHLVNTYGAFGSVGRERFEIVLEGTADAVATPATLWLEYGFRAKPGDLYRLPPQIAPYHLRLDWQIWFLPFSVSVTPTGIRVPGYQIWFLRFIHRLLTADPGILRLMGSNPFPTAPPTLIRANFYRYRFTDPKTRSQTGAWWAREILGTYLAPISLAELRASNIT